jgi:hypothetical protein
MKKTYLKENNGGGLQIELHEGLICTQVVAGLEFGEPLTVADIVGFGDAWIARDASQGYDEDGNTMGDLDDENENELTADDVEDTSEYTKTIAEYDHDTQELKVYVDLFGHAGSRFFGVEQ